MALTSLPKSTIVRIRNQGFRSAFRVGDRVAPGPTGRRAFDLWFTVPPALAATPLPPGGEPFTVTVQGSAVRGHVWGSGPVAYLVHGWGGRGSQLAGLVEPLVLSGHRVVLFDGPAHGDSDPGPLGRGRTSGVELGRALDAVAARFGPAEAVVAHSMGAIATYLALRFGWLGTSRLVLISPMVEATSLFAGFQAALGFGPRTRRAFDRAVDELVGVPLAEFDAREQAAYAGAVPTLVVHDVGDRQTAYDDARLLAETLPDARFVATEGLGHRRILRDPDVIARVTEFVRGEDRVEAA